MTSQMWLVRLAALATASVASADVVHLELRGSDSGRSAAISVTMDDTAGTMTLRIRNLTQGDGLSARNLSAFFWSFTGVGLDGSTTLVRDGTSSLRPWAATGTPVSPSRYWGLQEIDGLPSGATQALGLRTLSMSSPADLASNMAGASAQSGGFEPAGGVSGLGSRSQSDGTLLSATGSQVPGGRNQYRDFVEFTYSGLADFYAAYRGARHVSIVSASAQFGSTMGDPNVGLLIVPLPPAAGAGLAALAGLAGFRALRRRSAAR